MRRYTIGFVALAVGLVTLAAAPAGLLLGHHAFEVDFDPGNTADLSGIVTKIDWVNPHAFVFINVQAEGREVRNVSIELGPPYALVRGGWQRQTVDIGDSITMENVALARDGTNRAGATRQSALVLADGKRMVLR
jgi:hypothetical protein